MSNEKSTKVWKTVASFQTFSEADEKRKELAKTYAMVKVRRLSGGFKVKVWNPPEPKKDTEESSVSLKKGENNKRKRKKQKAKSNLYNADL